ncbi:hypothetical protein L2E82_29439 [Cichorium intybus]|uniref:Uncharacterized protein n=1 Tax=Cichorium intybus TaxID=13427 RepID=A0ACB9CY09_CICIN|nr:hypothetical protein L2E82_29439 [Cichorium intybus]
MVVQNNVQMQFIAEDDVVHSTIPAVMRKTGDQEPVNNILGHLGASKGLKEAAMKVEEDSRKNDGVVE